MGFLVTWPTLPKLVMFPVLALAHRRLAIREEREMDAQFAAAGSNAQLPAAIHPRKPRLAVGTVSSSHGSGLRRGAVGERHSRS